jgi:di/tricarboxylate transporter
MPLAKFAMLVLALLIGGWILGLFPHVAVGVTAVVIVFLFLVFGRNY